MIEQDIDWERTCWAKRFLDQADSPPCLKPAKWRGPVMSLHAFERAWRACDEHKRGNDQPMEIAP